MSADWFSASRDQGISCVWLLLARFLLWRFGEKWCLRGYSLSGTFDLFELCTNPIYRDPFPLLCQQEWLCSLRQPYELFQVAVRWASVDHGERPEEWFHLKEP